MLHLILIGLSFTLLVGIFQIYSAHIEYMHHPYKPDDALVFWHLFVLGSLIGWTGLFYLWRWLWT